MDTRRSAIVVDSAAGERGRPKLCFQRPPQRSNKDGPLRSLYLQAFGHIAGNSPTKNGRVGPLNNGNLQLTIRWWNWQLNCSHKTGIKKSGLVIHVKNNACNKAILFFLLATVHIYMNNTSWMSWLVSSLIYCTISAFQCAVVILSLWNVFLGYKMVKGCLRALGHRVQWNRVWDSMRRVDSAGILERMANLGCVVRRTCSVPGPLSLLHIDTNHKLIR